MTANVSDSNRGDNANDPAITIARPSKILTGDCQGDSSCSCAFFAQAAVPQSSQNLGLRVYRRCSRTVLFKWQNA